MATRLPALVFCLAIALPCLAEDEAAVPKESADQLARRGFDARDWGEDEEARSAFRAALGIEPRGGLFGEGVEHFPALDKLVPTDPTDPRAHPGADDLLHAALFRARLARLALPTRHVIA